MGMFTLLNARPLYKCLGAKIKACVFNCFQKQKKSFCAGGPVFRLKGSILSMSFLDCNGALIPYSYEAWKDDNRGAGGGDSSRRDRNIW